MSFEDRQTLVAELQRGDPIRLVPEPDNPHDSKGVKVCREDGTQVGYLRREDAARFPELGNCQAYVHEVVGGGEYNYGLRVLIHSGPQVDDLPTLTDLDSQYVQVCEDYRSIRLVFKMADEGVNAEKLNDEADRLVEAAESLERLAGRDGDGLRDVGTYRS